MKNVGIITFHKSLNYGSALQAWALSKFLSEREYNVQIIDYTPVNYSVNYGLFYAPKNLRLLTYDVLHLLWLPFLLRRNKDFIAFRQNNLPLSNKQFDHTSGIKEFSAQKDIMISGSDQIWNPTAKDFDMNYLLQGVQDVRKISYAASMGQSDFSNVKNKDEIRKCLLDFDYISVREETGAKKVKNLIGDKKDVSVVLDPTLLLDKKKYEEITSARTVQQPYIFFYSVRFNEAALIAAKKLSQELKLPVYTLMSTNGTPRYLKYQNIIKLSKGNAGPSGFLELIKNAEYVITDSFHGVAFSIIFEKNFLSVNRIENGKPRDDERITNLLKQLNLMDRYIFPDDIKSFDVAATIDYSTIQVLKEKIRAESVAFLDKALEHESEE